MAYTFRLSDEELRLFRLLLTGTERDKAIRESDMTKYDIPFLVIRIEKELEIREKQCRQYEEYKELVEQSMADGRTEVKAKSFGVEKNQRRNRK